MFIVEDSRAMLVGMVPDDWLGLWVAEGDKTVELWRDGATFLATITRGIGAPAFPASDVVGASAGTVGLPATWVARSRRLPHFLIEADPPDGRTYVLEVAVLDGARTPRAATAADPVEAVRLCPSTGPGFLDAVSHMDDECFVPWAAPFVPYRKATPDEVRTHVAGTASTDS